MVVCGDRSKNDSSAAGRVEKGFSNEENHACLCSPAKRWFPRKSEYKTFRIFPSWQKRTRQHQSIDVGAKRQSKRRRAFSIHLNKIETVRETRAIHSMQKKKKKGKRTIKPPRRSPGSRIYYVYFELHALSVTQNAQCFLLVVSYYFSSRFFFTFFLILFNSSRPSSFTQKAWPLTKHTLYVRTYLSRMIGECLYIYIYILIYTLDRTKRTAYATFVQPVLCLSTSHTTFSRIIPFLSIALYERLLCVCVRVNMCARLRARVRVYEYVSRSLFHRNPPTDLISEAVHNFFCLKFNET